MGILCFPGNPSLAGLLSHLEEAFIGSPDFPVWALSPLPVLPPSQLRPLCLCSSLTTLVWCQVCLPPGLSVTTVSPASPSLGVGTESMNEMCN